MHVNGVSKNVGEQGRLQSLVETFIGQEIRWWGTYQPHLQTWTTTSTYFIERFRGTNLTIEAKINKFLPRNDPQEHINNCESDWKRIGYRYEKVLPDLLLSTLNDLPNKWYKIEEAQGDIFIWKNIKENFIKGFSFNTQKDH